jgi:hypothetical protein
MKKKEIGVAGIENVLRSMRERLAGPTYPEKL